MEGTPIFSLNVFLDNKQKLRRKMRMQRRNLSEKTQAEAGLSVLAQFKKNRRFRSINRVAVYWANEGELPLTAIIDVLWRHKKTCLLPIISNHHKRKMYFATYQKDTRFSVNQYGIFEPILKKRVRSLLTLDLVLMPLVAFDAQGNRLGMGGGYYDRSFAFLKQRSHWKKPFLMGVAYDFQEVDNLTNDPWDVPLDAILTPTRLICF